MADRRAELFMTPEEFRVLVERLVDEFGLHTARDRSYVYVAHRRGADLRRPGKAIRLQIPRVADGVLYKVQHDLRTTDPELPRLFDRLRRRWRQFVSNPVRATNVVYGGSSMYRDLWFTAGALDLHQQGWQWRQEGVDHVIYEPDKRAHRPPQLAEQ